MFASTDQTSPQDLNFLDNRHEDMDISQYGSHFERKNERKLRTEEFRTITHHIRHIKIPLDIIGSLKSDKVDLPLAQFHILATIRW